MQFYTEEKIQAKSELNEYTVVIWIKNTLFLYHHALILVSYTSFVEENAITFNHSKSNLNKIWILLMYLLTFTVILKRFDCSCIDN